MAGRGDAMKAELSHIRRTVVARGADLPADDADGAEASPVRGASKMVGLPTGQAEADGWDELFADFGEAWGPAEEALRSCLAGSCEQLSVVAPQSCSACDGAADRGAPEGSDASSESDLEAALARRSRSSRAAPGQSRWLRVVSELRRLQDDDADVGARRIIRFGTPLERVVYEGMRVLALWELLWVPFVMSFDLAYPLRRDLGVFLLDALLTACFVYGASLRLRTSFVAQPGLLECRRLGEIRAQVLEQAGFWLDVGAVLAFPLLYARGALGLLAALRLLRCWRFAPDERRALLLGRSRSWPPALAQAAVALYAAVHLYGCCWFAATAAASAERGADAWSAWAADAFGDVAHAVRTEGVAPVEFGDRSNLWRCYARALGDGVSILVAAGHPKAASPAEQLCLVLLAPLGALIFASATSFLVVSMGRAAAVVDRHGEQVAALEAACASRRLPAALRRRIGQHFRFVALRDEAGGLLEQVSPNLQEALIASDLFRGLGPRLLCLLASSVSEQVFSPGDVIIRRGEVADCMYFIVQGVAAVWIDEDFVRCARRLQEPMHFGQTALLQGRIPRTAWVTAEDFCVTARLDKESFDAVLKTHPESKRYVQMQIASQIPGFESELACEPMSHGASAAAVAQRCVKRCLLQAAPPKRRRRSGSAPAGTRAEAARKAPSPQRRASAGVAPQPWDRLRSAVFAPGGPRLWPRSDAGGASAEEGASETTPLMYEREEHPVSRLGSSRGSSVGPPVLQLEALEPRSLPARGGGLLFLSGRRRSSGDLGGALGASDAFRGPSWTASLVGPAASRGPHSGRCAGRPPVVAESSELEDMAPQGSLCARTASHGGASSLRGAPNSPSRRRGAPPSPSESSPERRPSSPLRRAAAAPGDADAMWGELRQLLVDVRCRLDVAAAGAAPDGREPRVAAPLHCEACRALRADFGELRESMQEAWASSERAITNHIDAVWLKMEKTMQASPAPVAAESPVKVVSGTDRLPESGAEELRAAVERVELVLSDAFSDVAPWVQKVAAELEARVSDKLVPMLAKQPLAGLPPLHVHERRPMARELSGVAAPMSQSPSSPIYVRALQMSRAATSREAPDDSEAGLRGGSPARRRGLAPGGSDSGRARAGGFAEGAGLGHALPRAPPEER